MKLKLGMRVAISVMALFCFAKVHAAAPAGMSDKITALKKALEQNQAALKQYQWIETVTVSKGGDQKSQKQYQCYYGVDGAIQKVEMNSSQDNSGGGGRGGPLRRAIMKDKKEEMADYMKDMMALIKKYVPPQSSLIQAAKDANNVSIKPEGSGSIQLVIQNYLQKGDALTIGLNMAKPEVDALSVNTYLNDPKDVVTMQVSFSNLPDGTSYTKQTVINSKDKDISITTVNSGYRKAN